MILKIIAFGFFWNGRSSYILDRWNAADMAIVILGVLPYTCLMSSTSAISSVRLFRI